MSEAVHITLKSFEKHLLIVNISQQFHTSIIALKDCKSTFFGFGCKKPK